MLFRTLKVEEPYVSDFCAYWYYMAAERDEFAAAGTKAWP